MTDRPIPAPTPTPETETFWQGMRDGKFLIRRCIGCGRTHWYPRALCPFCFGETEWIAASGAGVIYSFSVMRRAPEPYAIAYVTLAEGPTMLTNLVGCDFDALRIGQDVRLSPTPTKDGAGKDGPPVPTFTPGY